MATASCETRLVIGRRVGGRPAVRVNRFEVDEPGGDGAVVRAPVGSVNADPSERSTGARPLGGVEIGREQEFGVRSREDVVSFAFSACCFVGEEPVALVATWSEQVRASTIARCARSWRNDWIVVGGWAGSGRSKLSRPARLGACTWTRAFRPLAAAGCGLRSARRFHEGAEQSRLLGAVDEAFGVPLNADQEPAIGRLDALDRAVAGPAGDAEPVSEPGDCLMVKGVHLEPLAREDARQLTDRLDRDPVGGSFAGFGLAMIDSAVGDVRQMLVQRSAAGYVEQLKTAADGKNRHPAGVSGASEGKLELVKLGLDRPEAAVAPLAVGDRIEIGASG